MRYLGGKTRIGKHIASILNSNMEDRTYWEPFCGALGVLVHVKSVRRYASDVHCDLITMWRAIQRGWVPPAEVSEEEYKKAKYGAVPPQLRSFIGFGCSFGGKWFGGYARAKGRNWADESSRSSVKKIRLCQDVKFFCSNYDIDPPEEHMLIYCDPPYANTTGYSVEHWNPENFWSVVHRWSQNGHLVFISEYNAPSDFVAIWEKEVKTGKSAGGGEKIVRTEKLFTPRGLPGKSE